MNITKNRDLVIKENLNSLEKAKIEASILKCKYKSFTLKEIIESHKAREIRS